MMHGHMNLKYKKREISVKDSMLIDFVLFFRLKIIKCTVLYTKRPGKYLNAKDIKLLPNEE